jgi:hypothetical protein
MLAALHEAADRNGRTVAGEIRFAVREHRALEMRRRRARASMDEWDESGEAAPVGGRAVRERER